MVFITHEAYIVRFLHTAMRKNEFKNYDKEDSVTDPIY